MPRYEEVHRRSLEDREGFWSEAAERSSGSSPRGILDDSAGASSTGGLGGTVNFCYKALDRHADGGRADQVALIHDSHETGADLFRLEDPAAIDVV